MPYDSVTECVVGDIAAPSRNALVGGPFGSDLVSRDYVESGIPVIRGSNMGHGRWVDGEFAYVSYKKADALSANCARPGDLIFTQRGTLGQVALVPEGGPDRYLISQSQMKLTVEIEKADPLFLYYVFTSDEQQEYIRQNAIQTGVPHTNLGILRNTPLTLPPLPEQRAIAHILGTLDDKIELNRRMNQTLEEIARALFKGWFVDFDPVHAKAAGRQPAGMDAETAALFPSEFEDSELGLIPKGWRVGVLTDIATLSRESVNPGSYPDALFTHYSIPAYDKRFGPITELGSQIKSGKYNVPSGSVLVSKLNPEIDRVWLPNVQEKINPICSTEFMVFEPKEPFDSAFVYCLARTEYFRSSLRGQVTGTSKSHQRAQPSSVLTMPILIPTAEVVARADKLYAATFAKIQGNSEESRMLSESRDAMLPKLISGELRTDWASNENGRVPPVPSLKVGLPRQETLPSSG